MSTLDAHVGQLLIFWDIFSYHAIRSALKQIHTYKLLPWKFNQNLILYMYVFRHMMVLRMALGHKYIIKVR